MSARALVVGESLIDVVITQDGAVAEFPGGSPMNVAIGLARLGREVDLLTWYGRDVHGKMITDHLAESGVRAVPGSDGATRTPTAVATLDADRAATYVFDLDWQVAAGEPAVPLVAHTGSIAAVLAPGSADTQALLARLRSVATITYDPNIRPDLLGTPEEARPIVEAMVALSDVVKVSDEDLDWLLPGIDVLDVARDWCRHGPSLVVVTRGAQGALAISAAGDMLEVPTPQVRVADTVGAGDSFMSGLIDGLWSADLLGADRRSALREIDVTTTAAILGRATRIAAVTVARAGANPPWLRELAL